MTASSYGVSIGGGHSTTIASQTTRFGTLPVIRQFTGGMPGSLGAGLTTSQVMFYSFKCSATDYTGMAAGTYDSAITTWARGLPSGQKVYACYYHEPENDGFTLAQWRAAADHYNNLIHSMTGVVANLMACQIYMYGTLMGWNGRNINNYWPTTHFPDHIGFDFDGIQPGSGNYPDLTTGINNAQAFANSKGIPWSVTEFGASPSTSDTTHASRASWNTTCANQFSAAGAKYVIYWDDSDVYLSQTNEINAWSTLVGTAPTTTPPAPTGLSVTPASDGNTATVTWTGPTTGVDHWDAYLQGPGQTYPHKLNTSGPIAVTPRSYTFPTTPGTTYSPGVALVSAADSAGTVRSGYSSFVVVNAPNPGAGGHYPVITSAVPTQDSTNPLLYHLSAAATDVDGGTLTYKWTFSYPSDATVPNVVLNAASGDVTLSTAGAWNWTLTVTDPTNLTTPQSGSVNTNTASAFTPFLNLQMLQSNEDIRDLGPIDRQSKPLIDAAIQGIYFRKSPSNAKYGLSASTFPTDNISGSVTAPMASGALIWWSFTLEDTQLTQLLFATSVAQVGTGAIVGVHDSTGMLLSDFNGTPSSGTNVDAGFQSAAAYGVVVPLGIKVVKQTWGTKLFGQAFFPSGMTTYPTFRCSGVGGGAAKIGSGSSTPLWGILSGQTGYANNLAATGGPWASWTAQNQIWVGGQ